MTSKPLFRWEQDGSGGEHGTATYWPGTAYEYKLSLPSFAQAQGLQMRLETLLQDTRVNARRELLYQIARIEP